MSDFVTREDLIKAVENAAPRLDRACDRDAIRGFARHATEFAAGAWSANGCRCPISAAGIDRFQFDAQASAAAFDASFDLGMPPQPRVFRVSES